MYGYDPDQQRDAGGCREILLVTAVVFGVMVPVLGALIGSLAMVIAAFFLLAIHPLLGLLPFTPLALGIVWAVRRDRRIRREMEGNARERLDE
jgi:MFS-type transporter involved in bile tolerance (Atg22 family)